jgi:xylulokinase
VSQADLVVGVDASTTAVKALAFTASGEVVAEGRAAIVLDNPAPDAWEQDANSWWTALCGACRDLAGQVEPRRFAALAITHQRETVVVTDERGEPRGPALVWMDKRGKDAVARAERALGGERLHRLSGKPACTTPSLYKLMALFARVPELSSPSSRVLDVHAFLVWRLSGTCATSLASADPMGMVDMVERRWAPELLGLLGLATDQLPTLHEPGVAIGTVSRAAAAECGLPEGLTVVAGAGDGQAAGIGAGIVAPGCAYLNLGTAVVSGVMSHEYRCERAFRTLYAAAAGSYFLETDLQGGTFTLGWLTERFAPRGDPAAWRHELEEKAALLPPGAEGLAVVPYWNGVMNPYWDDDASGIVIGWRGHHGPSHLYRAILEGIAFEQRLHTTGVEEATTKVDELVVMGGGSASDLWCQIVCDVMGKPVVRARAREATALGAAMLAAVHAAFHPDLGAASAAMTGLGERFDPGANGARYDTIYREIYHGLYPLLAERLERLGAMRAG